MDEKYEYYFTREYQHPCDKLYLSEASRMHPTDVLKYEAHLKKGEPLSIDEKEIKSS